MNATVNVGFKIPTFWALAHLGGLHPCLNDRASSHASGLLAAIPFQTVSGLNAASGAASCHTQ